MLELRPDGSFIRGRYGADTFSLTRNDFREVTVMQNMNLPYGRTSGYEALLKTMLSHIMEIGMHLNPPWAMVLSVTPTQGSDYMPATEKDPLYYSHHLVARAFPFSRSLNELILNSHKTVALEDFVKRHIINTYAPTFQDGDGI